MPKCATCKTEQFEAVTCNVGGVYGSLMVIVQCANCKTAIGVVDQHAMGELYKIRNWIKSYGQKVGVPFTGEIG